MEPRPFRIEEMRRDDPDARGTTADGVGGRELAPLPRFEPAAQQAEANSVAQGRTPRHRGDPAQSVTRLIANLTQDGAALESFTAYCRHEADELRPVLALKVGTQAECAADERLLRRGHAPQ